MLRIKCIFSHLICFENDNKYIIKIKCGVEEFFCFLDMYLLSFKNQIWWLFEFVNQKSLKLVAQKIFEFVCAGRKFPMVIS